ncbi:MAG: 50S ribosomal protein L4 [Parcubacteria group bacterium GW2011_GWB1_48_6]|nr:MAG: 50S ribosomal protein L4 [Parcubacteria group bacterium GW2011_GWB1_48_6]HXK35674.1 50S ribosomal protein L4 [Candidatus Paceibacterota bacterium]
MQMDVYNQTGEVVRQAELPEAVFGLPVDSQLIAEAVLAQAANSRLVLAHTKDRSEVRGGGKKPWRQKGTGRARHGSTRSPLWKGGGVTFGPTKERNWSVKINKKVRRRALLMALSSKAQTGNILLLEDLQLSTIKTSTVNKVLLTLGTKLPEFKAKQKKTDSLLLVIPEKNNVIEKSARNLPRVEAIRAQDLNPRAVLKSKFMIMLVPALPVIEKTFKI